MSALYFCELYIWSSDYAWMGMVSYGKGHERARLNERPILMRWLFIHAAMIQACFHMFQHYDRIAPPSRATSPPPLSTLAQLQRKAVKIVTNTLTRSLIATGTGSIAYLVLMRGPMFGFHFAVARRFYTLSHTRSFGIPGAFPLILSFLLACCLLVFSWEVANALFTIYLSQPPLKQGQPLTNFSKDPNGSLLTGLRRPKEFPRSMAFWELSLITRGFDVRRKTIFEEIQRSDRSGDSTWAAVSKLCLDEIRAVTTRINAFSQPIAPPPPPAANMQVQSLPKITPPLKDSNVWDKAPPPKKVLDSAADALGNFARAHGSSPGAHDPFTPRAKKLLEQGADKFMTPEQRAQFQPGAVVAKATGLFGDFLRLPYVGPLFRQTFTRRATAVVCGSPYAKTGIIISSVDALTQLARHSLKEDKHGCVQQNVLEIFRTFSGTIKTIETFLKTLPPHWTDVDFHDDKRQEVHEVNDLLEALKAGLSDLLLTFGEYMGYLGANGIEVKDAKALVKDWQDRYDMQQRLERLKTST